MDIKDIDENLQEQIKVLQYDYEVVTKSAQQWYSESERLKAEIERLKPFEDKIAEFNSHIRVEDMLVFASSLEEWLEFCDNLKSEAYKEFAERVKLEFYYEFDELIPSIMAVKIDNFLKELVGEYKPPKTETQIKFEAYHECIEKIKKRAEHSSCSVAVNTIADNVLKELIKPQGENNDN